MRYVKFLASITLNHPPKSTYPVVDFGGWKRVVGGQIVWKMRIVFALSDADFNPQWHCELKG